MITVENEISSPGAAIRVSTSIQNAGLVTVKVYARHKRTCPICNRPDWAGCNCVKWLYIYRDGKDKSTSAKTRSWKIAEQKAREIRDSFDPIRQLQRQLELR